MLEQVGRTQFRHLLLSSDNKRPHSSALAASTEDEQDAGWDFFIESEERDQGNLEQLR